LKGWILGLRGKQKPPPDKYMVDPSFVEWMMRYPDGWTE